MSSVKHYMPLYVGDYLADTAHLTTLEHGAYLLLIMHYWRSGGLPNDEAQLARIARMANREWKKIRPIVSAFFGGDWSHERIDSELKKAQGAYERRAKAGKLGGETKAAAKQSPSIANKKISEVSSNARSMLKQPEPKPEPKSKIVGVISARTTHDLLEAKLREAAGKALDPTSINLFAITRPLAWLTAGCDIELDILPTIRAISSSLPPNTIRAWKYFEQAVASAKATRLAPMPEGTIRYEQPKRSGNAAKVNAQLKALFASGAPDGES